MGIIRTIKGEDGRPYISLEDLIKEIEGVKKSSQDGDIVDRPNFIDVVLSTLYDMETQYYERYLFNKRGF
jgi:hypothetical protein